jgi:hypothetical protein
MWPSLEGLPTSEEVVLILEKLLCVATSKDQLANELYGQAPGRNFLLFFISVA